MLDPEHRVIVPGTQWPAHERIHPGLPAQLRNHAGPGRAGVQAGGRSSHLITPSARACQVSKAGTSTPNS
jgi:hypothetical protein